MRNDAPSPRGGVPRGHGGGFFSARSLSNYVRIVSSGASTAASTLRSAGASLVSSIASHEDDDGRDQVHWAGFDKLECRGDMLRQVLLLAYRSGFQVWDVEQADDVRQLASRHDGPVSFMQVLKKPIAIKKAEDRFADVRPLLVLACDGTSTGSGNSHDAYGPLCNVTNGTCQDPGMENFPTLVRFYSLRVHDYVHVLKFRSAVYSIRCSPQVVAVAQAAQIHCFDAATLEREYTILTYPVVSQIPGAGGLGYGPLALGSRWLAYSGSPVMVPNNGRVSPQLLSMAPGLSPAPSNGSVVAYFAKESSKQLASGIVTLGDIGYKKLSKYCAEFMPNNNGTTKHGNPGLKANGTINGHITDSEYAGMVIVRDIVSKLVIVQFRAHTSPISALCFDPSGTLLVTASIHGRHINVFRIMPSSHQSSSETGPSGTYSHLYKLQRGITNAVIKDISFSDDSEWIMISSSRGTSHLFAISPYSGSTSFQYSDDSLVDNNFVVGSAAKPTVHRSQNSSSLSLHQKILSMSGPPITLSVVSRIRNGSNLLKGAVHGAAAFATGLASPISGAIASTFHNCKGSSPNPDVSSLCTKYYLLVFSPSGSIIQYMLHRSSEQDIGIDFPASAVSYGLSKESDTRFVVEAIQKWDVCHKRNRRDRVDNFDIYGDFDKGENTKLFQKGMKKGTSIYPSDCGAVAKDKPGAEENHHLYISESELQTHVVEVPLWSKSWIHFQATTDGGVVSENVGSAGGEIEIEKIWTRDIESRSKNLIPIFDSLQISRFQQARVNSADTNRQGPLLRQKSGFSEDGRLSCRSSCSSLDCMTDGSAVADLPNSVDENSFGQCLTEAHGAAVNSCKDNLNVNCQTEHVNNSDSLKTEAQLGFVNNKENLKIETHTRTCDDDVD